MADCCCNGKQTANLIYACSGSANTGLWPTRWPGSWPVRAPGK